jgi:hypothetical protein
LPPAPLAEVVERGSRLETAQDVALRQASEWHGTASAVFAMLGLLGVLFTASFDGAMQWLGLLPGALAAWCGWLLVKGWRKGPKARPVRRLRTLTGPISLSIVSVGEGAAAHVATRISMGGNVLRYPQSWSHLPLFDGDDTLHEVEVDTVGEVVRHDRLSLFEQLTRFAPVASWRSAVLAGGAGVVLLVALALGAADTTALKTGVQRLSGQDRSILADAPETLLGLDPRAGDWVRLSGTASCLQQADRTPRVTEAVLDGHAFRCPLLGWGQRQQLADAENAFAPEEIVGLTQLASGLRELAKLRNPDPYSTYARDASTGGDVAAKLYQMLSMARSAEADLNQTVLQVEKLCGEDGGVDCSILESRLVSLVRTDESWDALVGKARAGKLPTAFDFGQSDYTALADDIIAVVRPAFVRGLQKQLDAAWKEDAVSLVLDVRDDPFYVADMDDVSDHPLQRVAALDFVLSGVVKEVSKEGGRTLLQIERMDAPASTWRLFAPTLFALLALLIGAFGLSGFLRARRENLAREKGRAEWLSKMLR